MSETKEPPSFVDPSADIILTSSDGVDFPVMKGILSMASPVFRDMFSLPQGTAISTKINAGGATEGLVRVDVSENSRVLNGFLCIIYPVKPPKIRSEPEKEFEKAKELLITAVKYDAERAISYVFQTLFELIKSSGDTRMALRLYALASRYSLKDHIRKIALVCLRGDIIEACQEGRIPEFESMNANALLCLFTFQREVSECVLGVIKRYWEGKSDAVIWCNECGEKSVDEDGDDGGYYYQYRKILRPARWWRTWIASVESAVKKAPLCDPFSVSHLDPLPKIANSCRGDNSYCRDFELNSFADDEGYIYEEVHDAVEMVGHQATS